MNFCILLYFPNPIEYKCYDMDAFYLLLFFVLLSAWHTLAIWIGVIVTCVLYNSNMQWFEFLND